MSLDFMADPTKSAVIVSEPMRELMQKVERVARTHCAVLISGETGSGKEIVARALHYFSVRSSKAWIDVNCGALPEHLVESELFGYEKGAFSGAEANKPGFFEMANGGCLFLDEIGELAARTQVKLLRVLDGTPYYRLGGVRKVSVDVRIIAATNRNLEQAIQQGEFRNDLYHRLNQFHLRVPPLRERLEDIVPLANHFLSINFPDTTLAEETLDALETHSWPGNVRELRNVVLAAAMNSENNLIRLRDLPSDMTEQVASVSDTEGGQLSDVERRIIIETLAKFNGHQQKTAESLGISRRTLSRKLKSYSIIA